VPDTVKNLKPKFKGFRRTSWFVGDPAKREAHFDLCCRRPYAIPRPLTRTWREGEPVKVYNHNRMGRP